MKPQRVAEQKKVVRELNDAVVTRDHNQTLIALGNCRTSPDPTDSGYSILKCTVYELEDSSGKDTVRDKLSFRVPTTFGKSKDHNGYLRLPDFTLTPARESELSDGRPCYELHLFFRDWVTYESQCVFLQGTSEE